MDCRSYQWCFSIRKIKVWSVMNVLSQNHRTDCISFEVNSFWTQVQNLFSLNPFVTYWYNFLTTKLNWFIKPNWTEISNEEYKLEYFWITSDFNLNTGSHSSSSSGFLDFDCKKCHTGRRCFKILAQWTSRITRNTFHVSQMLWNRWKGNQSRVGANKNFESTPNNMMLTAGRTLHSCRRQRQGQIDAAIITKPRAQRTKRRPERSSRRQGEVFQRVDDKSISSNRSRRSQNIRVNIRHESKAEIRIPFSNNTIYRQLEQNCKGKAGEVCVLACAVGVLSGGAASAGQAGLHHRLVRTS
mgnify:FL=1